MLEEYALMLSMFYVGVYFSIMVRSNEKRTKKIIENRHTVTFLF